MIQIGHSINYMPAAHPVQIRCHVSLAANRTLAVDFYSFASDHVVTGKRKELGLPMHFVQWAIEGQQVRGLKVKGPSHLR